MGRLLVACAALTFAYSARAEEIEVRRAAVGATPMKAVRRIAVDARDLANVVFRPWARSDAELVARKTATDRAALAAILVEVTVLGDTMSIRFGERVDGTWTPLRAGSRIDLVVDVPARLMGQSPMRPPVEPAGVDGAVAVR